VSPESRAATEIGEICVSLGGEEYVACYFEPSRKTWTATAAMKPPRKRDRYWQGYGQSPMAALNDLRTDLRALIGRAS
jgi:hypothetical protein